MTTTTPAPALAPGGTPVPGAPASGAPVCGAPVSGAPVCRYDDLEPERGVAALVDGVQVALFRLADGRVLAVGHRDPFSGANVIARGIVGTRGDVPTVASPMFKQVFDLRSGGCLDDPAVSLGSYPVQVGADGVVRVLPPGSGGTP